jgi:L-histidine N-alpha-methyltransferase
MATQTYQVLDPATFDPERVARVEFAEHVLVGLSEHPRHLSSRYFYDVEGSELFAAITDAPEYYPTRCEFEIFARQGPDILRRAGGRPFNLVDLGAGDGRKTAVLLEQAAELGLDVRYVPIDISEGAMSGLVRDMGARLPGLEIAGLVSEYGDGVRWLREQGDRSNLVLFLGSNIGNFSRSASRAFLRRLWSALSADDHVLIGFDLKKDIELLLAAYNDEQGVTARFNLNLLHRINRDLGADFDPTRFRHYSTYNVFSGAMESYLVSLERQTVHVAGVGARFDFAPWEPIHTEYSYKYLETDIDRMASDAGFDDVGRFFDEQRWFCDALWRVRR